MEHREQEEEHREQVVEAVEEQREQVVEAIVIPPMTLRNKRVVQVVEDGDSSEEEDLAESDVEWFRGSSDREEDSDDN